MTDRRIIGDCCPLPAAIRMCQIVSPAPDIAMKGENCNYFLLVQGKENGGCKARLIHSATQINGAAALVTVNGLLNSKSLPETDLNVAALLRSLPRLCGEQLIQREKQLAQIQLLVLKECLRRQHGAAAHNSIAKAAHPSRRAQEHENTEQSKESRSQKHARMLKEVVAKTLTRHGVAVEHKCFAVCSQRLFEISKFYLKDLKTSRGLHEEMKKAAKSNAKQVIDWVLEKTSNK
ncbi:UNVERIFIED_CONTAM: hypothetical protein FKN15_065719 [Acipenser sinensis]